MKPYNILWCYFDFYHFAFFLPKDSNDLSDCQHINIWQGYDHILALSKSQEHNEIIFDVIINRSMDRQQKLDIILKRRSLLPVINAFLKSKAKLCNKKLTKDQIIAEHLVTWEGKENLKKAMLIV